MNEYLSKKFRFISLISMVAVVFMHTYNKKYKYAPVPNYEGILKILTLGATFRNPAGLVPTVIIPKGMVVFFEFCISNGIARFAVPMFFITSGYFFFRKFSKSYELQSYFIQVKKRIKSLLVPYIIWALWGALILYIVFDFASFNDMITYFCSNICNLLLNPKSYQLWFIFDLMKLTVISPIIYFLVKRFKKSVLLVFFIFWLLDIYINSTTLGILFNVLHIPANSLLFSLLSLRCDSYLFFSIGAYLAIFGKENLMLLKDKKWMILTVLSWLGIAIVYTFLARFKFINPFILLFLYKFIEILGILSIWMLYDFVMVNWDKVKFLKLAVISTFMIYAFHVPINSIIGKLFFNILGKGSLASLLIYLILPISLILISIGLNLFIKKYCKTLHSILTGGR